jgi:hypothetical protein
MSESRPEPDAGPDRDAGDSPAQREYEAGPAAYDARIAARYAELQAAQAAQADRGAAAEAEFWAMCAAEDEAEAEAELG